MIGVYFSGTGNTKYCVERLIKLIDGNAVALPMEGDACVLAISKTNTIIFGYGAQHSDMPYFVRRFIIDNKHLWKGKNVLCVAVVGSYIGDGAGCGARLLKKYGANILGGLHIRMPNNVCDERESKEEISAEKLYLESLKHEADLKKLNAENKQIIKQANEKIAQVATDFKVGKYPQDGLSAFARFGGSLGQRIWARKRYKGYNKKIKVNEDLCNGCRVCTQICPMKNLVLEDGVAVPQGRCTACYRCANKCPQKAITVLGDKVTEQYKIEKYL